MKRVLRIIGSILLSLVVLLVAVGGVCHYLYYSSPAADLPCRGCEGEARAVEINGFELYYREMGHNPTSAPIVLIHGGPGQSSQTFKDGFDFLADDFRVIFYDQRGSGNSQIKPEIDLYTVDLLVEELETLRREVIRADKIILVGHSAGGALTLRYAMAYPEHVEKMVLVCAISPNNGVTTGGPIMESIVATMNVFSGNLPPADPLQADQQFMQSSFEASINRLYDSSRIDLLEDMGYTSFAVNRAVTRSTLGGNFDAQLSQLTFPTLIIYGKADNSNTGESVAEQFHGVLSNSTLVVMEHSGHWPYLEEPEQFRTALQEFLIKQYGHFNLPLPSSALPPSSPAPSSPSSGITLLLSYSSRTYTSSFHL